MLDYSIVIPVFNKAELTRNCLSTLRPTLEGAGDGEVIVVDNASSDETPELLASFPWVRVIRNERNLGFAAANNQGAHAASGKFLVLLNNDTQGFPGWLAAMLAAAREESVGAVGAKLLYPTNKIQHGGVVMARVLFGRSTFTPFHYALNLPKDNADANERWEYQAVTGACLVTPRDLYLELGGLDEIYWNGYEDVDYCLKVRARGLRVIYEPRAQLYHFESKSGVQRFRKLWWNVATLSERWREKVDCDSPKRNVLGGGILVLERIDGDTTGLMSRPTPPVAVVVHGKLSPEHRRQFEAAIGANRSPVANVLWCDDSDAIGVAREAMRIRGERFVAFVAAGARLNPGWLDELLSQVLSPTNVAAATFAPELPSGQNVTSLAADARCTLLSLKQIPQHLELRDLDTLDGSTADLLLRALECERGTRGVRAALGELPPLQVDAAFEKLHGFSMGEIFDTSAAAVERVVRSRATRPRGLVSIVTLSWNASEFTKKALESIARFTSEPYEVIVVDNGSGPETLAMLRTIDDPHVRVRYNPTNRGYAGGNNDGIADARGEYVVLLNNDVIVTDGWLDGLLDPFRRLPAVGITAPRSNRVVGHQQLPVLTYQNENELVTFAAARREEWSRSGYFADRAIGLCLCIDRRLLQQIGGMDERFGLGNFEDDDFCIRTRAAGYSIYVCDDVFIHHFGSRSFEANKVDYTKTMHANWAKFSEKWGLPHEYPAAGYHPRPIFSKGFDRDRHYVALPQGQAEPKESFDDSALTGARIVFYAAVHGENQWSGVAEFASRFVRAFKRDDGAYLAIGLFDSPVAESAAHRIERILQRAGIDAENSPDIELSDESDVAQWKARVAKAAAHDVASLKDRSPSALRRLAGS